MSGSAEREYELSVGAESGNRTPRREQPTECCDCGDPRCFKRKQYVELLKAALLECEEDFAQQDGDVEVDEERRSCVNTETPYPLL